MKSYINRKQKKMPGDISYCTSAFFLSFSIVSAIARLMKALIDSFVTAVCAFSKSRVPAGITSR